MFLAWCSKPWPCEQVVFCSLWWLRQGSYTGDLLEQWNHLPPTHLLVYCLASHVLHILGPLTRVPLMKFPTMRWLRDSSATSQSFPPHPGTLLALLGLATPLTSPLSHQKEQFLPHPKDSFPGLRFWGSKRPGCRLSGKPSPEPSPGLPYLTFLRSHSKYIWSQMLMIIFLSCKPCSRYAGGQSPVSLQKKGDASTVS